MANVLFKRGLEDALFARGDYASKPMTYEDGCFYLTTDTNRLYIGVTKGTAVALEAVNEGVTTVKDTNSLPKLTGTNAVDKKQYQGRFYYCTDNNILVVCSGDHWVQINPDTTLTASIQNTAVSDFKEKGADTATGATITSTVSDSKNNNSVGSFSIVQGDNVTVTSNGIDSKITISAKDTSHTLKTVATGAGIALHNNLDTTDIDNITFTAVNSNETLGTLAIANNGNNDIKYTLDIASQAPTSLAISNGTKEDSTLTSGFKFEVANPLAENITATLDPVIRIGKTDTTDVKFDNNIATLDVYTTAQTDAQIASALQAADAMTFVGVLGSGTGMINATNLTGSANEGDTYKIGTEGDYFGHTGCKVGDLLIAAKDGSSYLTANDWYYIPSGDDQVISGSVSKDSGKASMTITDTAGTLGKIIIEQGTDITVTGVVSKDNKNDANDNVVTTTIAHATYSAVTPSADKDKDASVNSDSGVVAAEDTFTAITSITESNGHLTGIKTSTFSVKDTHNQITAVSQDAEQITNGIGIAPTITTSDSETITTKQLNITSTSLDIGYTDVNNVTFDLVWGTF